MNFTANPLEREMKRRPRPQALRPDKPPRGLPVLWLSLLARHPLRLLLSVPLGQAGREVMLCVS